VPLQKVRRNENWICLGNPDDLKDT